MIDNFVMLGKTVPEPTSERLDQYVCSAGWSWDLGLIRLYPLGLQATPRRWSVNRCELERHLPNKDSRIESWRPTSEFESIRTLPRDSRGTTLRHHLVSGMVEANERRLSLAAVRPVEAEFYLADGVADDEPSYQLYSHGEALKARERFAYAPRVRFLTEDGRKHDLQMREWGIWELMRKHHEQLDAMTDNERERYVGGALRLTDQTLFLIGNYANHRSSWLVIASLNV